MPGRAEEGVILELFQVGCHVNVLAIDSKTGVEALIVGDPVQGETLLKRTAIRNFNME